MKVLLLKQSVDSAAVFVAGQVNSEINGISVVVLGESAPRVNNDLAIIAIADVTGEHEKGGVDLADMTDDRGVVKAMASGNFFHVLAPVAVIEMGNSGQGGEYEDEPNHFGPIY